MTGWSAAWSDERKAKERVRQREQKRRYNARYPEKQKEHSRHLQAEREARCAADPDYHEWCKARARDYYNARKDDPDFRKRCREAAELKRRRKGIKKRQPKPPPAPPLPPPSEDEIVARWRAGEPLTPKLGAILSPETRLILRRESWRQQRARWKAANHEKAIAADRASWARNKHKHLDRNRRRKAQWKTANPDKIRQHGINQRAREGDKMNARSRLASQQMTAAVRFLIAAGVMTKGPQETTMIRRRAALAYIRAAGLLPRGAPIIE